jgi:hypothetical protein
MPKFDQRCKTCDWWDEIVVPSGTHPPCPTCGGDTERFYIRGYGFERDEFPGGKVIENLGHEPVVVHSRSELKDAMAKRGLQEFVRHVPTPGSDKSPHTQRFV